MLGQISASGRFGPHVVPWFAAVPMVVGVLVVGFVLYLAWRFVRAYEAHTRR